ncbi:MAG: site-specific integrase [Treponema sp.]|nr:site-specific integrase [Treponema sp.]
MNRHLYQRKIGETKAGKPIKAYYFWYLDPITKKQIRKSCGTSKNPVFTKREAESIIETLEEKDREYLAIRTEKESATIAKMAENMFHKNNAYIKRRRENGYLKDDSTIDEIHGYLNNFILLNYGHLKPEEIDPVVVDQDLIKMDRSNSWRNRVVSIINFILDEAIWLKMIKYKPALKTYKKTKGKKDILAQDELNKLFPDDFDALSKIWDTKSEVSQDGFMFGVLFALKASTGMRSGEVRAISDTQLIATDGKRIMKAVGSDGKEIAEPFGKTKKKIVYGILLDRMCKNNGDIVNHLKKGDEDDPKMRVSVIPKKTMNYLKHWLSIRVIDPKKDLLFTFKGRLIRREYLEYRFEKAVINAKIDMKNDRKLTPHSLRFTYNTKMRRKISINKLSDMMGHENNRMTDYYTIINMAELEEQFLGLSDNNKAIDKFWGV